MAKRKFAWKMAKNSRLKKFLKRTFGKEILFFNLIFFLIFNLIDTGENVQKWTRVFSTRRWVILVARTRRKKEKQIAWWQIAAFTFERFRLWTSFESSLYWLNVYYNIIVFKKKSYLIRQEIDIAALDRLNFRRVREIEAPYNNTLIVPENLATNDFLFYTEH